MSTLGDFLTRLGGGDPDANRNTQIKNALLQQQLDAFPQEQALRLQDLQADIGARRGSQRESYMRMQALGQEQPYRLQQLQQGLDSNALRLQSDRQAIRSQMADAAAENDLASSMGMDVAGLRAGKQKFDLRSAAMTQRKASIDLGTAIKEAGMTEKQKGEAEADRLFGFFQGLSHNSFSSPQEVQDAIAAQGKLEAMGKASAFDRSATVDAIFDQMDALGAAKGIDTADLFTLDDRKDAAALIDAFLARGLPLEDAVLRTRNKVAQKGADRRGANFTQALTPQGSAPTSMLGALQAAGIVPYENQPGPGPVSGMDLLRSFNPRGGYVAPEDALGSQRLPDSLNALLGTR